MSPTFMFSKFTSLIIPFTSTFALTSCIEDKSLIALVVFCTDLCSNTLPKSTKVIIVAVVSKNK